MITKQTLLQSLSRFLADCKNIFASKNDTYTKAETNSKLDEKADKVLMEKTFGPYTVTENNIDKGWIYFINVVPTDDNWFKPWRIHYKLYVSTTEDSTQGVYDCVMGAAGTTIIYSVYNEFYSSSYPAIYQHTMAWHSTEAKYAERATNPIKIGARLQSARSSTTLARTYKFEILEVNGCTASFMNEIQTHDSFYDANKYGYDSQVTAIAAGIQEVGDTNYPNYYNYFYYNSLRLSDSSAPLYRFKLVGFDEKMRIIPFNITNQTTEDIIEKTPTPLPFKVSNGMAWYGTTTNITNTTTALANGSLFSSNYVTTSLVYYNFNTPVGSASNNTLNCSVYFCGDYNPYTDEFTLDRTNSTSWYTVVSNNANDATWKQSFTLGKYYWFIGQTNATDGQFGFFLDNPLYYFDGNELVPITTGVKEQTENKLNQSFIERKTNCTQNVNYAKILSLKGNSIVWNQLAPTPTEQFTTAGITITYDSFGKISANGTLGAANTYFPIYYNGFVANTRDHKYFFSVTLTKDVNGGLDGSRFGLFNRTTAGGTISEKVANNKACFIYKNVEPERGRAIGFKELNGGTAIDAELYSIQIDLTQMFGEGNEPSLDECNVLFNIDYYKHNDGEVLPFCAEKLVTTGINQWDEEWESGGYSSTTGEKIQNQNMLRSSNHIHVLPNTAYYVNGKPNASSSFIRFFYYDSNKNFIGASNFLKYGEFITPVNCQYLTFYANITYYGSTIYDHDICINLSDPSIDGQYFPYEAPKEMPIKPLTAKSHNIWDEEWEQGAISVSGSPIVDPSRIRPKSFIPVKPNTVYNLFCKNWRTSSIHIIFFANSGDTTSISSTTLSEPSSQTFTIPANCHYIKFSFETAVGYGGTYRKDICINQSSSFNGNYDPYGVITIHKWGYSAGSARNEIKGSKYIKRLSEVDMGTLNYAVSLNIAGGNLFRTTLPTDAADGVYAVKSGLTCAKYVTTTGNARANGCIYSSNRNLDIIDGSFSDAAAFKTAMSGVPLYYELANPIEYDIVNPSDYIYHVNKNGTEAWLPANGEEPYTAPCYMDIQYGIYKDDLAEIIVDKKPDILALMGIAPTLEVRWSVEGPEEKDIPPHDKRYIIKHPLMDMDGAEFVLLRYAQRNRKKIGVNEQTQKSYRGGVKKGYCVAIGANSFGEPFIFSGETKYSDLENFINNYIDSGASINRHWGIALRLPNPEWNRQPTIHKNAIYKGVHESLWSAVLPILITQDKATGKIGLGIN